MIIVHVWKGLYGHVSLEIKDNSSSTKCYISFWPKSDSVEGIKNSNLLDVLSVVELATIGTKSYYAKSYEEDMYLVGKAEGELIQHTDSIDLHHLDEQAIIDYWHHLLENKPKYGLYLLNCSTVVAQCLTVGWIASKHKGRKITSEEVKQELKHLKRAIVDGVEKVWTGKTMALLPVYKYTGEAIGQPDLRPVVGIGASFIGAAGMLTAYWNKKLGISIFISASVLQFFALTFEEMSWDPRLAQNIALYLQDISD